MTDANGRIKTDIKVLKSVYDVSVDIPTANPTEERPYKLQIFDKAEQEKTAVDKSVPMLVWLQAYYNPATKNKPMSSAPDNVYMELSPPPSILPSSEDFAIQNLSISFGTGLYKSAPEGQVKGTLVSKKVDPNAKKAKTKG